MAGDSALTLGPPDVSGTRNDRWSSNLELSNLELWNY